MIGRHLAPAAALLLAACAAGAPVTRQVVVSGAGFSAVQGESALVVRTATRDAGGALTEVIGAECAVVTSLYETRLVTPARLVVPNFGPQSPELNLDCRSGDLRGAAGRAIRTYARGGYYGPYVGYPGAFAPWGPWGWAGPAYVVSSYPDVVVELR